MREIRRIYENTTVLLETTRLHPPFPTRHGYEDQAEVYEKQHFFQGDDVAISDLAPTESFLSVNDPEAMNALFSIDPEILFVFGTKKISEKVLGLFPGRFLNLHGGDPERYRGLDSHLWSIYHNDFDALVTTLHMVNPTLDDGPIVLQSPIPISREMELHELRLSNTEVCVDLCITAVKRYVRHHDHRARSQDAKGRYYSFMPSVLKEICVKKFQRHTATL